MPHAILAWRTGEHRRVGDAGGEAMIEIVGLAASIVSNFLVPYVTHGLKGIAEGVSKAVTQRAGDQAAEVTERVWDRVESLFREEPGQEYVLERFKKSPERSAPIVQDLLAEVLESRPELVQELAALVDRPVTGTNSTVANVLHNSGVSLVAQNNTLSDRATIGVYVNTPAPESRPEENPD